MIQTEATVELSEGMRIYYTGDAANQSGFGVVTRRYNDKWGQWVDIKLDEETKQLRGISTMAFGDKYEGHGGHRFFTEEAYNEWRTKQLEALKNMGK